MNDKTLSEQERNRRLHLVYVLWQKSHKNYEEFVNKLKKQKFNLLNYLTYPDEETAYFSQNNLFKNLRLAYEGKEEVDADFESDEDIKRFAEELKIETLKTEQFTREIIAEEKMLKSIFING